MQRCPTNPIDAIRCLDTHLPEWEQNRSTAHLSGVERFFVKVAFQLLSTLAREAMEAAIQAARAVIEHKKESKKKDVLGGEGSPPPVPPASVLPEPPILSPVSEQQE